MRKILILIWLLIPIAAMAYHLGPGQREIVLDVADSAIHKAEDHQAKEKWTEAVAEYERALSLLPETEREANWRLRIEKAKAQMMASELPAANKDLKALVDELQAEKEVDAKILADARAAMANSQYYRTWLMRLEGLPRETWEPEIESARQTYKLLAENTSDANQQKKLKEDLESSIRLAHMDLKDLQGLPLPSQ